MTTILCEDTPPELLADVLRDAPIADMPDDWWNWPNATAAHQLLSRDFLASLEPFPVGRFVGRGVVICAGGHRLFTNGWVCMRVLRHLGCQLPIEFWHFASEIDPYMAGLVRPYDVQCVDADAVAQRLPQPPRFLAGWELKPFAILHSRFQEVLLLDADNVPVVNPEFLFDTPQYRATGSIFWPDYSRMEESRGMWEAAEVPYRDEPEFESGQIVVDKFHCWEALNLTVHYNEHSDFYYKHVHGDKCTFQFAWPRTGTAYSMPSRGIHSLDATMCQHDFDGQRIFQHRNMDKWRLDGSNRRIDDFQLEKECRRFLAELRKKWNGHPFWIEPRNAEESAVFEELTNKWMRYDRVGYDRRLLEFLPNGTIGEGAMDCERYWSVHQSNGSVVLTLLGDESATCHLVREGKVWRGAWLQHERMPIELREVEPPSLATLAPERERPPIVPAPNGKPAGNHYVLEYGGGLGDVLEQIHHTPDYRRLAYLNADDRVTITLICHCPTVTELFEWHPKRSQFTIVNPGYWQPEESEHMRRVHGLPAPTGLPAGQEEKEVVLHISPKDREVLAALPERFVLLSPTAGLLERDIPLALIQDFVARIRAKGLPLVAIGANYERFGRHEIEFPAADDFTNLVDRLSVPGAIEVIRRALGGLYCFSAMHIAAALIGTAPQLLLYPGLILGQHRHQVAKQWPFIAHALFENYDERLFERFWGRVLFAQELRREGPFRTLMPHAGQQALYETVLETSDVPGAMLEAGVYRGGGSRLMALACRAKRLYACDTFSGACDVDPVLDSIACGHFAVPFREVVDYLSDLANVTLVPGPFHETSRFLEGEAFSCAHGDLDTYQGTRQFLEFVYPRMSSGGRILCDDYFWHECPGVRKAVDEFFQGKPETVTPLGTNHVVVEKL